MKLFFFSISLTLSLTVCGQDSLYASYVEDIYVNSYSRKLLKEKRLKTDGTELKVSYFKSDKRIRSIISWKEPANQGRSVLYLYSKDSLIMVSPVGQQPYYVRNKEIVFAPEVNHTSTEMSLLIDNGGYYIHYCREKIKTNSR